MVNGTDGVVQAHEQGGERSLRVRQAVKRFERSEALCMASQKVGRATEYGEKVATCFLAVRRAR